jgi:hypothetical protein
VPFPHVVLGVSLNQSTLAVRSAARNCQNPVDIPIYATVLLAHSFAFSFVLICSATEH